MSDTKQQLENTIDKVFKLLVEVDSDVSSRSIIDLIDQKFIVFLIGDKSKVRDSRVIVHPVFEGLVGEGEICTFMTGQLCDFEIRYGQNGGPEMIFYFERSGETFQIQSKLEVNENNKKIYTVINSDGSKSCNYKRMVFIPY